MIIDAKGKACPEPVILTKKHLETIDKGAFSVIVDNKASSENVRHFAENAGCGVSVSEQDGIYTVQIAKGYECDIPAGDEPSNATADTSIVLHFSAQSMGPEEPELGRKLTEGFIGNIINMDRLPDAVIFVNTSVMLLMDNENTIASLKGLEDKGVEILACGACLEYFERVDDLKVGKIADAHTVMTKMFNAGKLIKL